MFEKTTSTNIELGEMAGKNHANNHLTISNKEIDILLINQYVT